MLNLAESQHASCVHVVQQRRDPSLSHSLRSVIRYTAVWNLHTHTHSVVWYMMRVATFLLTRGAHASTSLTYTHAHAAPTHIALQFLVVAKRASDVCQTKLRTNTGTKSFILPDQMMRVAHTDTHAGFVLCDQMMRVAVRACYIHPPVPYIIPAPSILCDTSFDAL